jgi:hypothetical protein
VFSETWVNEDVFTLLYITASITIHLISWQSVCTLSDTGRMMLFSSSHALHATSSPHKAIPPRRMHNITPSI